MAVNISAFGGMDMLVVISMLVLTIIKRNKVMEQYIPKSALVAEIERRIKAIPRGETDKRLKAVYGNEAFVLHDLLSFINTLEVKEVDLKKEIDDAFLEDKCNITDFVSLAEFKRIAKHFFELGLKAQKGE